jgi:hypothetical protein
MEMGDFIYNYLIEGIYLAVLLIVFVRLFTKKIVSTDWTIQFIRWAMIVYSVFRFIDFLKDVLSNETLADIQGESISYHGIIFFFAVLVIFIPFVLLDSKIGKKLALLFFVGLLLNVQSFALIYIWSLREYTDNMVEISEYGTRIISRISIIFISLLSVENGLKAWTKKRLTQ